MGMGTRRHHRLTLFAGTDRELVFFRLIQKCEPSSLEKGHYSELNDKKCSISHAIKMNNFYNFTGTLKFAYQRVLSSFNMIFHLIEAH